MENTPLSGLLTYRVIDMVAAQLCGWLRTHPEVYVSINVPPEILGRGGLIYAIHKAGLRRFSRQIVLEITERGIPDRLGWTSLINRANPFGIRFALDDVTMSGANLAILTRCPFNIIKIERTAVQEIVPGAPRPERLQGLAAILPTLRVDVVAEGVETAYQAEALRESGIRFAQGFYFARPTSAARSSYQEFGNPPLGKCVPRGLFCLVSLEGLPSGLSRHKEVMAYQNNGSSGLGTPWFLFGRGQESEEESPGRFPVKFSASRPPRKRR